MAVNVILDWFGSHYMDRELLALLEHSGVKVVHYHKPDWRNIGRMNNRTHRKLLIVDGRVGFIGGVGIADQWMGDAEDENHWRDTHFRVEGPVVHGMQSAFMDNWMQSHSVVLHDGDYFPPLSPAGPTLCQILKSSPREGSESVRLMYLLSIAAAEKTIHISSAYFVPDGLSIQALCHAARRGVRIQIMVPGRYIDRSVVRKASRRSWGRLLEAGIEIYQFWPTMYHCKTMVVDELWVTVGSTNVDNRSFRRNDEANLNALDAELARKVIERFKDDISRCRRIDLEQWKNRPWREKLADRFSDMIRSQL